jgi:hypothetical protein
LQCNKANATNGPDLINLRQVHVFRTIFLRLFVLAAACAVLAYPAARLGLFEWPRQHDPFALPDLVATPGYLTSWQMQLVDMQPNDCALVLQRAGLAVSLKPTKNPGSTCEVSGAISLSKLSAARIKPEDMRCALAARLYLWERHVLQPLAQIHLGQRVAEIIHFGSFSCRLMRGGRFMSEHATANAFDIAGFRLANGRIISLKRDWQSHGAEGQFLRAARNGLCDWFNVTLSPDYNAAHADHFHVDMGWWQTCR